MNWFRKSKPNGQLFPKTVSILYDENSFYNRFTHDLLGAKHEVIIESPFITMRRLEMLKPIFETLVARNVKVFITIRDPSEHDEFMAEQAEAGIHYFEVLGVQVLIFPGGLHRKLAMIDRKILWEGA